MRAPRASTSIRKLALQIVIDEQAYTALPACRYVSDRRNVRAA